jgi:CheY-like chemotaxis protein
MDASHPNANCQKLLDQLQNDADTQHIPVILIESAEQKSALQSPLVRATLQIPAASEQLLPAIEAVLHHIAEE